MCRNGRRQASLISMPSGSPTSISCWIRRQCEGSAGHGASRFAGYDIQRLRTSSSQSHGRGSGADRHTTFGPRSCTQRVPPGGRCRTRKRNCRINKPLRFSNYGGAEGDRTPDLRIANWSRRLENRVRSIPCSGAVATNSRKTRPKLNSTEHPWHDLVTVITTPRNHFPLPYRGPVWSRRTASNHDRTSTRLYWMSALWGSADVI